VTREAIVSGLTLNRTPIRRERQDPLITIAIADSLDPGVTLESSISAEADPDA
jgi:hypothetical protein